VAKSGIENAGVSGITVGIGGELQSAVALGRECRQSGLATAGGMEVC